jgi:hypothetical protein
LALAAQLVIGAAGLLVAAPATAASTETHKVNSWQTFKITPKVGVPKGYTQYGSKTITVKRGSSTVARNKTSYAAKGTYTYKVTSTVKYRTKRYVTTTRTEVVPVEWVNSCTARGAYLTYNLTDDTLEATLAASCEVAGWNSNGTVSATVDGVVSVHEYYPSADQADQFRDRTGDYLYVYPEDFSVKTFPTEVTSVKTVYGPVKSKSSTRYVKVIKRPNGATMTWTEYKAIKDGQTLAQVRAIAGSKGKRVYADDYSGTAYEWKNSDGGTTWVWFNSRVRSKYWYTW